MSSQGHRATAELLVGREHAHHLEWKRFSDDDARHQFDLKLKGTSAGRLVAVGPQRDPDGTDYLGFDD